MKHRNPIFVAGFPYVLYVFGYIGLQVVNFANSDSSAGDSGLTSLQLASIAAAAILLTIAGIYCLYWSVSTARAMRQTVNADIPNGILLVIPLVSYYWYWKYSKAVETYTKGKIQAVLAFIVIVAVGSIGMGILQDTYNKTEQPGVPAA